jgi:NAD/NADP transhydrogenase beta subunit
MWCWAGSGTEGGTVAAGAGAGDRLVRSGSAEDAAFIMKNASYDEVFELEEINRDFASTKPGGRKCDERLRLLFRFLFLISNRI